MLPNFSADELKCQGSGLLILAPGFGQALQGLRDALTLEMMRRHHADPITAARMAAMPINSACRSAKHNADVGGHPRSLHVGDEPYWPTGGCCAVDVRAPESRDDGYRGTLASVAWALGWSIGNHPSFLHLDLRTQYAGLPQAQFNY